MLNAPATGEAMSELILDGAARHVDLAPRLLRGAYGYGGEINW
jgi:hypothetical protein